MCKELRTKLEAKREERKMEEIEKQKGAVEDELREKLEIQKKCLDEREERLKKSKKVIEEDKMCLQQREEFLDKKKEGLMKENKEQKRIQALLVVRDVAEERIRERIEDKVEKRVEDRMEEIRRAYMEDEVEERVEERIKEI